MSRHFHLCKDAVELSVLEVARWTETRAAAFCAEARWGSKDKQACPYCNAFDAHWPYKRGTAKCSLDGSVSKRRRKGKPQWKCKQCRRTFSVTSNTPFQDHKKSLTDYLGAMLLFVNAANGKAATELRRNLRSTYETAFVLGHKIREVLVKWNNNAKLTGEVEVDGAHYCGAPRGPRFKRKGRKSASRPNVRINPKRLTPEARAAMERAMNKREVRGNSVHPNRRIVVVLRERSEIKGKGAGRSIVAVSDWEDPPTMEALAKHFLDPDAHIITDESPGFRRYSRLFKRHDFVNHSETYCDEDGVNENQAESFFARGDACYRTHHRAGPKYLLDYACEWVWREQTRHWSNKQQLEHLLRLVLNGGRSEWWLNYKRGNRRDNELMFAGPRLYPPPAASAATPQ